MNRRTFIATSGLSVLACATGCRRALAPGLQRGIALDGYQARAQPRDLAAIKSLGATHLALSPFGFMRRHTEPAVFRYTADTTDWSLTDVGLRAVGRMAQDVGLQVILIPTLVDFTDGHWRGEVRMNDEQSWSQWFRSYQAFILHYAALATDMRAVGFSVGTELRETMVRERQWRETVDMIRETFRGWLTYAANWDDYQSVPWWDAVDLIGVQAYFELGDPGADENARLTNLVNAWTPIRDQLATLSDSVDRRVLFTEIGYKSHTGATQRPWQWELDGTVDEELQALAYEAAFRSFWAQPWFAGLYWWKWRPHSARDLDPERDFTPQGKRAEAVVRQYYSTK